MRKTKQKKGNVSINSKRGRYSKKQAAKLKDLVLHIITKEISS